MANTQLLSVDFAGLIGPYGIEQARKDFKDVPFWDARADISAGRLRVKLLKNALHEGGFIGRVRLPDLEQARVEFDFTFDKNFDFSAGGKLGFGLLVGKGQTGGDSTADGTGGSARLMWRKDEHGNTYVQPYIYYYGQKSKWGDYLGSRLYIDKNVKYRASIIVRADTGRLEVYINGKVLFNGPIQWSTNRAKINALSFETFRGGSEAYWKSSTDGYIYFDNVVVTKLY